MKTILLPGALPGLEKPVSKIVLGTMIIGRGNYAESATLLDHALRLGIQTFDLAWVYGGGESERALGQWMAERGNREEVFLITKGAHPNADRKRVTPYDITADLMDSLTRLRTDFIDLYLLHRDDPEQPVGPIMDALHEHCRAGRIRAIGGSNWSHERIAAANAYAAACGQTLMRASSPNYSLCEQVNDPWGPGCTTISGPAGAAARAFYQTHGIAIFAYSSLGRGMLSGRVTRENHQELLDGAALTAYAHEVNFARLDRARALAEKRGCSVSQIGLAYLLSQPLSVCPIVGAASPKELDEAATALEIALTKEECGWLENGEMTND